MIYLIPLLLLVLAGCQTAPAPGWEDTRQDAVLEVASTLAANPGFRTLIEDVDKVYMGLRETLNKQDSSSLVARWIVEFKEDDMKRLRALNLDATDSELIVGLIVAGGLLLEPVTPLEPEGPPVSGPPFPDSNRIPPVQSIIIGDK